MVVPKPKGWEIGVTENQCVQAFLVDGIFWLGSRKIVLWDYIYDKSEADSYMLLDELKGFWRRLGAL